MKNKLFLMIMVVMVCSLTACGQQETGTMTNTGNSTEQVVTSEDNSDLATAYSDKSATRQRDFNQILKITFFSVCPLSAGVSYIGQAEYLSLIHIYIPPVSLKS